MIEGSITINGKLRTYKLTDEQEDRFLKGEMVIVDQIGRFMPSKKKPKPKKKKGY